MLDVKISVPKYDWERHQNPDDYIGLKVVDAYFNEDADRVTVTFEGGKVIYISDQGQCCCEHRYITCDDTFSKVIGGTWLGVEVKGVADDDGEYDVHEQAFVDLRTTFGTVTFTTHNEHNGYYGGFYLVVHEQK